MRALSWCCLLLAGCSGTAVGENACVDLSHFDVNAGDPTKGKWDLHVIGTGFEADEGQAVRLVVTLGEPSYALGATVVQNGGFDIVMPGTTEPYSGMGVYLDRRRNDACDVDADSLWQRTTGGVDGDYVWNVTPGQVQPSGAPPCNINGIFDLTIPLRCP